MAYTWYHWGEIYRQMIGEKGTYHIYHQDCLKEQNSAIRTKKGRQWAKLRGSAWALD